MTIGLIGKKSGMTRIYGDDGAAIPVSVIEVLPNRITQIKTQQKDGYCAVQLATGNAKRNRVTRPQAGHFAKANVEPAHYLHEFAVADAKVLEGLSLGSQISLDQFNIGDYIDVTGLTKGKGFAGTIKRYHFRGQDNSHGNSVSHRKPGSIGQRQSPGKVFKNKKMCGHLGDAMRTIMSQMIVRVDAERGLIFIRGSVPGAPGNYLLLRRAIKKKNSGGKKDGNNS